MFHHHCADLEFFTIMMKDLLSQGAYLLERLFELKLTPGFKWNSSLQFTTKDDGNLGSSLYCSSNYLTPPGLQEISSKREYCWYIWAGAAQS